MLALFLKYLSLIGMSAFKFVFGPIAGFVYHLPLYGTIGATVVGMMFTVVVLSFGGTKLLQKLKSKRKKKLFTPAKRRLVRYWKRFGIYGVAFLTPIIFTPIGGTIIAVSFRERPSRIIAVMFFSAIFWASLLSFLLYYFTDSIRPILSYLGISLD